MDAIVNFGAMFQQIKKPRYQTTEVRPGHGTGSTLYTARVIRTGVPIIQTLLATWNIVVFILGCIDAGVTASEDYSGSPASGLLFYWCTIPFILSVNSVWELVKRWRQTLSPIRILFSGLAGIVVWLVALGIWSTCFIGGGDVCPDALNWEDSYDYALSSTEAQWTLAIATAVASLGVILYIPYLVFGIITFRHQSRYQRTVPSQAEQVSLSEVRQSSLPANPYVGQPDHAHEPYNASWQAGVPSSSMQSRVSDGFSLSETLPADTSRPPSYANTNGYYEAVPSKKN